MSRNKEELYKVKIKVIGVGGGGCEIVNRIAFSWVSQEFNSDLNPAPNSFRCGVKIKEEKSIEFIAINTDIQALNHIWNARRISIGESLTRGLGVGMNPELGRRAARSDREKIRGICKGADLIFIISCLGGGTGSGATPVVAEEARSAGALAVVIVTKPFSFEGRLRRRIARWALKNLKGKVDTLITISNDKILELTKRKTPLYQAFGLVDKVLQQAIQSILNLLLRPGIINIDFADMKTVMKDAGLALIGVGEARGKNRAVRAARKAINSPLLDFSIKGAKGVLFDISGRDIKMLEVEKAARVITESVSPEANVVFGVSRNKKLKSKVRVSVIATGLSRKKGSKRKKIFNVKKIEENKSRK